MTDDRWCCNGNAESCRLCTDPNPPYPWICPGHDDTPENRAALVAPPVVSLQNRRAHVHNAITEGLSKAGDWVPLSVRVAATRAALAEVDAWHAAGDQP
ncbi:hypothetical protein [Streptomyces sp. NPDC046925]|uniref:hypothetical protein n=1 Tax=Streptomyces sp. NPDC046925 TaxID=3155375 RepID=UPI00340B5623